jgi:1,4-alpha-glucan branching enzyme
MNNFLVKVVGDRNTRVFFEVGDDENLASDEFNNNLWELVGNFNEFQERTRRIEAGESDEIQKLVTLRYSDEEANSVSVIGSFNGWSPENSRMRRIPGGAWEITLSLRPGKYTYRFLVNNRRQVLDPSCPIEEPDGYGGKNSVIYVTTSQN